MDRRVKTSALVGTSMLIDLAAVTLSVVFGIGVLVLDVEEKVGDPGVTSMMLVTLGGAFVAGRRRSALAATAAIIVVRVGLAFEANTELALVPAAAFALYEVGKRHDRRIGYSAALLATALTTSAIGLQDSEDPLPAEFIAEAGSLFLPVALGDAARNRSDRVTSLIEAESQRRVQAERLRIARDLHDIVAHALTDISVQSGVAAHLLADENSQAKKALERINSVGKSSLEDLRSMVGVLRSTDEAPLLPTPTDPDDLDAVRRQAERSGVALRVDQQGAFPGEASEACVVAAHRIMEEAITNVARHAGPTQATVTLRHGEHHLELIVENQAGSTAQGENEIEPSGVGLLGMTERAESLGGSLNATTTNSNGFIVAAVLPYRPVHRSGCVE